MYSKARDVDISLYNSVVYNDNLEMVIMALSMYQKSDGGFGSNLDIDNYNPSSTVLSTSIALDEIYKAGIRSGFNDDYFKEMVHNTYKYLFKVAKVVDNKWNPLSLSNNKYPCASWLKYTESNVLKFRYSPTAALIGYGLALLEETDPFYKKCFNMAKITLETYLKLDDVSKEEIYSFNILKDETSKITEFQDLASKVSEKLFYDAKKIVCSKDEFANSKSVLPVDVFFSYTGDNEIDRLIDENIDYLIDNIPQFKLFEPNYSWNNDEPEGETALLKAFGTLTTKYIYIFKKFSRIEL